MFYPKRIESQGCHGELFTPSEETQPPLDLKLIFRRQSTLSLCLGRACGLAPAAFQKGGPPVLS